MEEASARVQDLERRHDLLRFTLAGWSSWPVLRFDVIRELEQLPSDTAPGEPLQRARWRRLRRAGADLVGLALSPRADLLVMTYASVRAEVVGGRTKDVFFDDLLHEIGRGFKIEDPPNAGGRSADAALIPPNMSTAALGILSERLAKRYPAQGAAEQARMFTDVLRHGLGITRSPDRIARSLSEFVWMRELYKRVLKTLGTRCVLTVNPEIALVAAARERRIPVAEVQHGFLSRYSEAYSWTSYAVPFKVHLPVPDVFFTHGPYWTDELAAGGFWDNELRTVGNARLDAYRNLPRGEQTGVCSVLLTPQGVDTERLIAFMVDALGRLEGRLNYRLQIKLHPMFDHHEESWRQAFQSFRTVEVLGPSQGPTTFELLSRADVHLSIFSSCHYEALGLGVPTVVLPLYGHQIVRHLWEHGHARLAGSSGELAEVLVNWETLEAPPSVSRRYYTPGAVESTVTEIRAMMRSAPNPS